MICQHFAHNPTVKRYGIHLPLRIWQTNQLVIPVVESLLGKGNLSPIESGQIALRFPHLPDMSAGSPHGHLDGLGKGLNGSSKGTYRHGFTMLAVVLLNHLPETHGGNFTVWPKSHVFFLKTTFEKTELEFWPMGYRG